MTEPNAPTALSLLLGLAPAPKAIPSGEKTQSQHQPLSGYGSGRLRLLAVLHQSPDKVFTAQELASATNLEISVIHKYLRALTESSAVTLVRQGCGGHNACKGLFQAGALPSSLVLRESLRKSQSDLASVKARAVALVLSCEPDEHGRLSLESIAQTLEDNL